MLKSFSLLLLCVLLLSSCEECRFCDAQVVVYEDGQIVEEEKRSLVEYCDELLIELREHPVDTTYFRPDSFRQQTVITTHSCL